LGLHSLIRAFEACKGEIVVCHRIGDLVINMLGAERGCTMGAYLSMSLRKSLRSLSLRVSRGGLVSCCGLELGCAFSSSWFGASSSSSSSASSSASIISSSLSSGGWPPGASDFGDSGSECDITTKGVAWMKLKLRPVSSLY
jgi:hypothetical protein